MVKLQEAENQIVIDFEVYDKRPNDSDLLIPAIEIHQATLRRAPHLVAADAAFYSGKNEATAKAKGVKRICIPNRSTKSAERRREQKKRWFRRGQAWRTGCEGRISVVKRRHGLNRCRYKGDAGMQRWVGLGVVADNLITIGRALGRPRAPYLLRLALFHRPPAKLFAFSTRGQEVKLLGATVVEACALALPIRTRRRLVRHNPITTPGL